MNDHSLKGLPSLLEIDWLRELGIVDEWISIALKIE